MTDVAENLADILERENTALAAMDLRAAGDLLAAKAVAIEALAAAGQDTVQSSSVRRLGELARANQRLLRRAMTAQERVIGIVVRAASQAEPVYGGRERTIKPVALSTRA